MEREPHEAKPEHASERGPAAPGVDPAKGWALAVFDDLMRGGCELDARAPHRLWSPTLLALVAAAPRAARGQIFARPLLATYYATESWYEPLHLELRLPPDEASCAERIESRARGRRESWSVTSGFELGAVEVPGLVEAWWWFEQGLVEDPAARYRFEFGDGEAQLTVPHAGCGGPPVYADCGGFRILCSDGAGCRFVEDEAPR